MQNQIRITLLHGTYGQGDFYVMEFFGKVTGQSKPKETRRLRIQSCRQTRARVNPAEFGPPRKLL